MHQDNLRVQNHQLKNELSQLKNAFNVNRDILKLLSSDVKGTDNQLFYLIINKLTSINNQASIRYVQLLTYQMQLKKKIQKYSHQIRQLKAQISYLTQNNNNSITQLQIYLDNNNKELQRQLSICHEKQIISQYKIKQLQNQLKSYEMNDDKKPMIKTIQKNNNTIHSLTPSYPNTKYVALYLQEKRQKQNLKRHIQEVQSRLALFIQAHKISRPNKKKRIDFLLENHKDQLALIDRKNSSIEQNLYHSNLTKRFTRNMPPKCIQRWASESKLNKAKMELHCEQLEQQEEFDDFSNQQ